MLSDILKSPVALLQHPFREIMKLAMSDADPRANPLCLDQFLKLHSIAETGGHAKIMIQGGEVKLNGAVEIRRRKKLAPGDVVEVGGSRWVVS